jgi:hypothetical protein
MMDKNFSQASWNTTQSIQNALASVNSLKASVPDDDYTMVDDIDKLEHKLYQAYKLALQLISEMEATDKNESN